MTSTGRQYFAKMYSGSEDPWNFATSSYEQRKYELTMSMLPRSRYRSAFEPGCSIGVLSELLARRCDRLLIGDFIPSVLEQARERLAPYKNVAAKFLTIPEDWPEQDFDLVVLSEILYYFDISTLDEILDRLIETTEPGAHVMAVHWRGETDYPLSADRAHAFINGRAELQKIAHHAEDEFVMDLWERAQ
ncbi:MAG TPA: SAM-dependent methyltransferase [Acidimicrobiales bacterium]